MPVNFEAHEHWFRSARCDLFRFQGIDHIFPDRTIIQPGTAFLLLNSSGNTNGFGDRLSQQRWWGDFAAALITVASALPSWIGVDNW
jgi:hypothetical protein